MGILKNEKHVAFRAALEAGGLIKERMGQIASIDYKSAFNLVTDVDKASEKVILDIIKAEYPGDQILAEESGALKGEGKRRWLIDPLDGTTNYAHSYPFFCVSIGLEENGEMVLGVVYDPVKDEMFYATKGGGAFMNDERIKVSTVDTLSKSLLTTGFPPDTRNTELNNMVEFTTLTNMSHGVRRDGSAALDLSYVASGRIDAFWEMKLAAWDVGAGSLIVEEAGGKVTDLVGEKLDVDKGFILATNRLIHDQVLSVLSDVKAKAAAANN
jgi:myo-inositol-1(or 4)-monophosphatase